MGTKKRNDVWDIVKGLGIVLVVAGHGFGGGISRFVNLFHIPLFIFVSGLVFRFEDRSPQKLLTFTKKCLKGLWLPSVIYGTVYVLLHNLFTKIGIYQLEPYSVKQTAVAVVKHLAFLKTEPLESAMWFFTALFICRFLLYGVLWISSLIRQPKAQTAAELCMVALIFAAGCFFFYRQISLPGNADNACTLLPFIYGGYKLKHVRLSRVIPAMAGLAVLIGLFLSGHTLRMSRNEITDPLFLLLGSAAGILLVFQLADWLKRSKAGLAVLRYIGIHTVPVLCLHLLAFRLVSAIWILCDGLPKDALAKHPIVAASYGWGILYTAFGVSLPLLVPAVQNIIKKRKG